MNPLRTANPSAAKGREKTRSGFFLRMFIQGLQAGVLFLFFFFPASLLEASQAAQKNLPADQKKICYFVAEKEGRESILFGTMHILSGAYLNNLRDQIISSKVIIMEVEDFSQSDVKLTKAGMFKGEKKLEGAISTEAFARANAFFSKHGIPPDFINRLQPWYLGLLAQILLVQEDISSLRSLPMDLHVLKLAQKYKVPIKGLETIDEQISYFTKLSPKAQEAFLLESIDEEKARKELLTLKDYYLRGQIKEIESFLKETVSSSQELYQSIFTERNHRMNETVLPYVEKGGAFVAVGFGHLVTETGMVEFLKKKGFSIRIKELTWTTKKNKGKSSASPLLPAEASPVSR